MRGVSRVALPFLLLAASALSFGQQRDTSPPTQHAAGSQSPAGADAPQPEGKPSTNTPPPVPRVKRTPKQEAWLILEAACKGDKTINRATAIRVLGLLPNDRKARMLAESALSDEKSEVRTAAAAALGDMKSRASIPKLEKALDDKDPAVALAAAHSLDLMHNDAAYEVYFEILSGDRKASKGLIATETSILRDKKKMAELGFEEGIGFIPFAGIGWGAIKTITKDDSSPVRAAAAKILAKDPDPATTRVLEDATGDKSWLVRAAALEALAKRGNPEALETAARYMADEKIPVRYTAAATVLRLTAIKESHSSGSEKAKRKS